MKIEEVKYYCPKCKREYENHELISFNNLMANAANEFLKNSNIKTQCEKCGIKLVKEEALRFFNEKGKLNIETKMLKFNENEIFDMLLTMENEINTIMLSLDDNCHINLNSTIEKIEFKNRENFLANSNIKVELCCSNQTYTFFDIQVDSMEYSNFGRKKNGIIIEYLICKTRVLIKILADYFSHAETLNINVNTNLNIVNFDKDDVIFYMKNTKID